MRKQITSLEEIKKGSVVELWNTGEDAMVLQKYIVVKIYNHEGEIWDVELMKNDGTLRHV